MATRLVFIKIVHECLLHNFLYFLCWKFLYLKKRKGIETQVTCQLYSRLLSELQELLFLHDSAGIESEWEHLRSSTVYPLSLYLLSYPWIESSALDTIAILIGSVNMIHLAGF